MSSYWNLENCSIKFNNKHGFIKQPFTMFYKIGVLKNFAEFTPKQQRSVTLIKKTPMQVLSCEFFEILKNPFWQNTTGQLLLILFYSLNCFLPPSDPYNRNQGLSIFEHVPSQLLIVMNITKFTSRNRRPSCSCWETDIPQDTRS